MHDSRLGLIDKTVFLISFAVVVCMAVVLLIQGDIRNVIFMSITMLWMGLYWFDTKRLIRMYNEKVTVEFVVKPTKNGITNKEMVNIKHQLDELLKGILNEHRKA